jgi:small subunit ribosomal protein S20
MRQSVKRRMHNRVAKKVIKTVTKKAVTAMGAGDLEKAAADLRAASSKIDKAGARGVLHRNTAARRKSRLDRAFTAARTKAQQQG